MRREIVFVEASTTGAGTLACQLARSEGLNVVVLTKYGQQYVAKRLASPDEIVWCNTNDANQVANAVRQRARVSEVVAVTTTADMFVPQAAYAAQELGLPGMRHEAALRARNKHRMRQALAQTAPEFSVPFALAKNRDEAFAAAEKLGYPLVVKPQEENDGYGVKLVHDQAELGRYMEVTQRWAINSEGQRSPPGALLEAYVTGPEFSVETIQYVGGPCQVIGVTTKELVGLERGCFVEVGHCFPYLGPEAMIAVSAVKHVLAALDIDLGAIHTECRISGGKVKIMEVNPRLAGGKIGSHLIEMATGRSAVRAVLDAALGKSALWRPEFCRGAAIHFLWSESRCVFRGIANHAELMSMPGIAAVSPIARTGARLQAPRSNGDYAAEILANGSTACEAYANVKAAFARARLLFEPI